MKVYTVITSDEPDRRITFRTVEDVKEFITSEVDLMNFWEGEITFFEVSSSEMSEEQFETLPEDAG